MYRDSATALDEHDRAVGAILIGEALIAQCERAIATAREPHAPERWRAIRQLHDDYPEIWLHLDRARRVLDGRGVNMAGYDDLRGGVATSGEEPEALEDARRAIAELKLAVPGADWKAIDKRTRGLVETPQLHKRHRLAVASVLTLFVLALVTWFVSIIPSKKPDPRAAMRQELATIAQQRKLTIAQLTLALGDRCDAPLAQELVKQLVMDGRGDDAERFADLYLGHCGTDTVVENWANAPRPTHP